MQPPDVDDPKYQPLYVDRRPSEGYDRYARDFAAYQTQESKAAELVKAMLAHGMAEWDRPIDLDNLIRAIPTELHRTEQQHLARVVRRILEAMAIQEYDDRNEAAVRFALAALDATKGIALPFI